MNNLILEASRYAERWHRGIFRKYTGEPYIFHPARVAARVSFLPQTDNFLVAAAWLHDVVEDCGVSKASICGIFGSRIAEIVWELTNPSKKYPEKPRYERKAMDLDHIAKISVEAKLIKICDRIDNLNDYPVWDEEAAKFVRDKYYNESVDLYDVVKDADYWLGCELAQTLENVRRKFSIGE